MKTLLKKFNPFFLALIFSCNSSDDSGRTDPIDPPDPSGLSVVNAFPELRFSRPLDLQSPADGTDRIFVVEQRGIIQVFPNEANTPSSTIFLDIEDAVSDTADEQGLLGLAFHPDYATNGYFFVCYNPSERLSVISRFKVSDTDPDQADASSETLILEIPQPFTNHNGGQLAFGPDGYLYIASGDGGSGGDPQGNAQNRSNLLGGILRIDVDLTENGNNYVIPADNPFVNDSGSRGELFAYGLRNPWRMSFDTQTGALWTGDVGQDRLEEINIIEKGNNYGWNTMEGSECFLANSCDTNGLTLPIHEYNQDQGDVSVTGGYVYRGSLVPELQGRYIYGDFASGRIWALTTNTNPTNTLLEDTNLGIASFGTDTANELYICSFDGSIYKFEQN